MIVIKICLYIKYIKTYIYIYINTYTYIRKGMMNQDG